MALTESQQLALDQIRELTNGGNDEVSLEVLQSVDWNVERAAELIFGSQSSPAGPSNAAQPVPQTQHSRPKPTVEVFEVDDSSQGQVSSWNAGGQSTLYIYTRPIFSLFAFPLHIISNILRFVLGILRIPVPQFRFSTLNFYRPLRPRPVNRGGPDRWVRELEEETGAVCVGRLKSSPRASSSTSAVEAGPSRLTARNVSANDPFDDGTKVLPDFSISSYEEFLRMCQREMKVGCVILVSEEHDDVAEFKRSTLTDTSFVKMLYNNNILVWGGDVRDNEAWTASEKLQATTYPFIAFVALQPKRAPTSSSSRSSSSQPVLTVLSRHQGKSYPPDRGPTSARNLIDHLERQLLPRVTPFLERLLAQQREREQDRRIREEQDRAYEEAARRDKERIEAKIAAEKAEQEARRRAEDEARAETLRKEQELAETRRKEGLRMSWRRWMRKTMAAGSGGGGDGGGSLRIAVRLPTGVRVIHGFSPETTLTGLYAYVDAQLIPQHLKPDEDPGVPPEGNEVGEHAIETQIANAGGPAEWWGFQLATAYPRVEIPWKANVALGGLSMLMGGGQVVVETLGSPRNSIHKATNGGPGGDDGDDGYTTESSDEE